MHPLEQSHFTRDGAPSATLTNAMDVNDTSQPLRETAPKADEYRSLPPTGLSPSTGHWPSSLPIGEEAKSGSWFVAAAYSEYKSITSRSVPVSVVARRAANAVRSTSAASLW